MPMTEAEAVARALNGDRTAAVLDRLELRLRELTPPPPPLLFVRVARSRWLVGRHPGRIIEVEARDAWMLWVIELAVTYSPFPFVVPPWSLRLRTDTARPFSRGARKKAAQRTVDDVVALFEYEKERDLAAALRRGLRARNDGTLVFEPRPGDVRIVTETQNVPTPLSGDILS